jgi:hypothetical protein
MTGVLLVVVMALFGLQWGSASRNSSATNRSVCKQADIQAVVPRLDEGKTSARKATDLARTHLFCPGADGIAADTSNRFSKVLAADAANSAALRLANVRGRAPPAATRA